MWQQLQLFCCNSNSRPGKIIETKLQLAKKYAEIESAIFRRLARWNVFRNEKIINSTGRVKFIGSTSQAWKARASKGSLRGHTSLEGFQIWGP